MISKQNQVTIVTVNTDDPDLEASLARLLPETTQRRLAAFTHAGRRRQTLWGRLAALAVAREHGLMLIETPPYPPVLRDDVGHETALSIAHTGSKIAVGVASSEDDIMGLDIETLRPVRSVRGMSEMAFGADIQWAADRYDASGDLEPFFLLWGMKEAEIKLNRGGDRFHLTKTTDAEGRELRPEVIDRQENVTLAVHCLADEGERLTVLTRRQVPLYFTVTAEALARRLLSGDN